MSVGFAQFYSTPEMLIKKLKPLSLFSLNRLGMWNNLDGIAFYIISIANFGTRSNLNFTL